MATRQHDTIRREIAERQILAPPQGMIERTDQRIFRRLNVVLFNAARDFLEQADA